MEHVKYQKSCSLAHFISI